MQVKCVLALGAHINMRVRNIIGLVWFSSLFKGTLNSALKFEQIFMANLCLMLLANEMTELLDQ